MRNKKFARVAGKVTALALSAAMMMTGVVVSASETGDQQDADVIYYGDVNLDGRVAVDDALAVLKDVVNLDKITDELQLKLADMNEDGSIAVDDALEILKVVVNLAAPKVYEEPTEEPAEPSQTPSAAPSQAPSATPTERPSTEPTIDPAWYPNAIPTVEPGTPYEGTKAEVKDLNGAQMDENGIITFTDENKAAEKGVQFVNPLAGRTDLRETPADAIAGQPLLSTLTNAQKTNFDPEAVYPRAKWNTGASISFWVRCDWTTASGRASARADAAPVLVLHDSTDIPKPGSTEVNDRAKENFALMVRLNGSVRFESGDTPLNSFRADSWIAGENHVWNYYTITFANDWITVYVNGQENVYKSLVLLKDEGIKYFNDGWMTRYNTIGAPTQEDLDNDIRGYIQAAGGWVKDNKTGEMTGHVEYGIIGNGRYANPSAVNIEGGNGSPLLMDYITGDNTELWIGGIGGSIPGLGTKRLSTDTPGKATYSITSGTQVADIQTYDKELTAEEVAANYAAATRPGETPAESEEPVASELPDETATPDETETPAE